MSIYHSKANILKNFRTEVVHDGAKMALKVDMTKLFCINISCRDAVQVEGQCFGKILDFAKSTGPTKTLKPFSEFKTSVL